MVTWTPLISLAVFGVALGIGDILAVKTKGLVSSILVLSTVYLLGFWTKIIPADSISSTNLPAMISAVGLSMLVCNLGTMLDINEMIKEWKTVVVALSAVVGIGFACFVIGIPVFGREYALSAAGPLSGGLVATIITQNAAIAAGKDMFGAFAMLVFAFQIFVGMPIAAFMIKRDGNKLKSKGLLLAGENNKSSDTGTGKKINLEFIPKIPEKYNTGTVVIAKVALVAAIGGIIASFTKIPNSTPVTYIIHPTIAYLIFGILFTAFGFLDKQSLQKAGANGFIMFACLTLIPSGFASVSPSLFMKMLIPLLGMLLVGLSGIIIFSVIIGKLVGYSPEISIAIGCTAFLGYPQTEIVTNEAVKGFDGTVEEKKALYDRALPKMLTGGFITVTIASIALAAFLVPMIF